MSIKRCAYCGSLAENPVQLRWFLDSGDERKPLCDVPLCVQCSQSWCKHEDLETAHVPAQEAA